MLGAVWGGGGGWGGVGVEGTGGSGHALAAFKYSLNTYKRWGGGGVVGTH